MGSDLALSDVLKSIKTEKDTDGQQPPVGYALIGWHVDDGIGVACSVGWDTDFSSTGPLGLTGKKGAIVGVGLDNSGNFTGGSSEWANHLTVRAADGEEHAELAEKDALKREGSRPPNSASAVQLSPCRLQLNRSVPARHRRAH